MKKTAIWSQIWDWTLVIPFVCCLTRFLQILNELTYMKATSLVTRVLVGVENNFLSSFNSYFPFSFFLFIIFPPPFSSIFLKSVFHITSSFSQLNLFCFCPFLAHLRALSSYPWRYRSSRKEHLSVEVLATISGIHSDGTLVSIPKQINAYKMLICGMLTDRSLAISAAVRMCEKMG